jgi:DNA-binding CsgD family transcriptional regulator
MSQEKTLWFSPREREVLAGIVRRKANKEIAAELEIAIGSVRNVVTQLLRKFDGLENRADLREWALQHPDDLAKGRTHHRRLHPRSCLCGSPSCNLLNQVDQAA